MKKLFAVNCVFVAVIVLVMACFSGCSSRDYLRRDGSQPAELVVVNARIFTSSMDQPEAESMAVDQGRIVFVGSDDDVADYVGSDTRIIDGRNRRVTPGFIDSHCHVLWIGAILSLMPANLFECNSFDDITLQLNQWASAHPELPFVGGIGWRMNQVPGGKPHKTQLDEVISDRPVILMSYSGQCGWMNSMAVSLLHERNPEALELLGPVRDLRGEMTGEFLHFHAINILKFYSLEQLGPDMEQRLMDAMTQVMNEAVSVGVTAMHDVQIYPEFIPLLLKFRDNGGLDATRVRCAYYIDPHHFETEQQLRERMQWWKDLGLKESDDHLILGDSAKLYIEGTIDNHTSFLNEPYLDEPENYGDPVWSQAGFDGVIQILDSMEIQACTHACGDAGIHRVVNGYEYARKINGYRDSRHRVEHNEFPTPADIKRMGELEITTAMQPCHFFGDEMVETSMGANRMQGFMPWRSLEKAGVTIGFGSDWCNSPLNPFYGLILATRRFNYKEDTDWNESEKITIENAVRHWTIDSARVMFMEDIVGSLEVGKYADFVIFNTDPLNVDSLWFLLTHELDLGKLDGFVDMTVVNGKVVKEL